MVAGVAILGAAFLTASRAPAQDGDATKILAAMSDYLARQKTISATFDSDIEVITSDLQKIQFSSTGRFVLARPDKLRVTRTGGYADVELVFDGKKATVYGKNLNAYAQLDAPGSVDQLIDRLRADHLIEAPGADILMSNVYDELTKDVVEARHIGRGVVDGVECEHLAFRNADVDWQLWVEVGARPIPRKYVITSKAVTGAPQYTLRLADWKTDTRLKPDEFAFKPPSGASKIELEALSGIDEVPPGVAVGASK
jgi:hypothetical protein